MADNKVYGICLLKNEDNSVSGEIKLVETQEKGKFFTHLKAEFKGLPQGPHGFHIHEFGNMSKGCDTAGPHFNPHGKNHGGPNENDADRHIGDLGNVVAKKGQNAKYDFKSSQLRLTGDNSIFGRSFVIHADEDDLGKGNYPDSKSTGHSGARLACCIIARSGPFDF